MQIFDQNFDHDTSTLQTNRQTDGQTTCCGNTTLCMASHGKNRFWMQTSR